jgi:hypothetical protein
MLGEYGRKAVTWNVPTLEESQRGAEEPRLSIRWVLLYKKGDNKAPRSPDEGPLGRGIPRDQLAPGLALYKAGKTAEATRLPAEGLQSPIEFPGRESPQALSSCNDGGDS